jgi:hypothetical protein
MASPGEDAGSDEVVTAAAAGAEPDVTFGILPVDVHVIEMAGLMGTLGPFTTAFCTELGKRFGGTVADWTSRVRLHRASDQSDKAEIVVRADDTFTVIELEEGVSDEARLALLDLDIQAEDIRGHRLKWDTALNAWVPVDIPG